LHLHYVIEVTGTCLIIEKMKTIISGSRAKTLWETQRYFPVKKLLSNSVDLFVSVGLMIAVLKFNKKTIQNGIIKNNNRESNFWSYFVDISAIFINWATASPNSLNKLGLPQDPAEMLALLKANEELMEEQFMSLTAKQIKSKLEDTYHHHYAHCLKEYINDYPNVKERRPYGQSHALMEEVIKMKHEKWNRAMIYQAYWQIVLEEIIQGHDPILQLGNAQYFWRVIKEAEKDGIKSKLVSAAKGVPRDYKRKLTGPIRAFIKEKLGTHLTYPAIVRLVETKFKVKIDVSSVKKFIPNDPELKNMVQYERNGLSTSRMNSMPKLERALASSPGEQYMADFYDVQFYVRALSGEPVILISFIIIDTFSLKIVGWALGRKDNPEREKIALAGFRMAFYEVGWMPLCILLDRDPYYRRPAFKRFKKKVMNQGVEFPPCPPGYAPFRAEMETTLGSFQLKVCSEKDFFKGADSRSRRHYKVGNPSQEFLNQMWIHKDKFPTEEDFRKQFSEMIIEKNTNFHESAA